MKSYANLNEEQLPSDLLWEFLNLTFSEEEAICFREYPVGSGGTVIVADFVILHRDYGLFVIELKTYQIDDIQRVINESWIVQTADFRSVRKPFQQTEALLQAVGEDLRDRFDWAFRPGIPVLVLPYMSRTDWAERFSNRWSRHEQDVVVLFEEDLSSFDKFNAAFRQLVFRERDEINRQEWEHITQLIRKPSTIWDADSLSRRAKQIDRNQSRKALSEIDRPLVFLSYRREDTAWAAGRLYGQLNSVFNGNIFWDYDSIKPGADWIDAINEALDSTVVLIAVIGKKWLTLKRGGKPRIFDPKDKLVEEIEIALDKGKVVVPVLIDDVTMPTASQLPRRIKDLSRKQALRIHAYDFFSQTDVLIDRIIELLQKAKVL